MRPLFLTGAAEDSLFRGRRLPDDVGGACRFVTLSTLARLAHALNRRVKIEFVPVKAKKAATAVSRKRAGLAR